MLTAQELRELVEYDPATGKFIWRQSGKCAGSIHKAQDRRRQTFCQLMINRKNYKCSRLAFLYMTGRFPSEIDHINRNSLDDRWENLREVSRAENEWNKGPYRNSKTGLRGVYPQKGFYIARIRRNGKRITIGQFATSIEAYQAYLAASQAYLAASSA